MRIGTPIPLYQAKTPSVPAVRLSPQISKALIDSGMFQQAPDKIVWSSPGFVTKALGGPVGSVAAVNIPGGATFHPRAAPEKDILLPTLKSIGKDMSATLDSSGVPVVADAYAMVVAAPEIFNILAHRSSRSKPEQFSLCAVNFLRILGVINEVVPIPHAEQHKEVIATLLKVGEEVFISGEEKAG